ncbi:MAG: ribosome biogenesis factor YjgA [Mariprofundaceae bacterium]|nr:ribosome biogenesis factor YjgA [Mariprofundaceae bacterium]
MNGFDELVPTDEEFPYGEGYDEEGYVIRPNKSQLRRDSMELLDLGKKLAAFEVSKLQRMNLPEELMEALLDVKKIRQNGARKRHFKFVGKLLRSMETEALEKTVHDVEYGTEQENAQFHHVERWRARLLNADNHDAFTQLMAEYPQADAGRMRQLIRNAHKEAAQSKPPRSSRLLFQVLRELLIG